MTWWLACWRKRRKFARRILWMVFCGQLTLICMVAIGVRDDDTRSDLHRNFVAPFTTKSIPDVSKSSLDTTNDKVDSKGINHNSGNSLKRNFNANSRWKFQNYYIENWDQWKDIPFDLKEGEDTSKYFRHLPDTKNNNGELKSSCFIPGTDWDASSISSSCVCIDTYHGDDCGIPDAAWYSHFGKKDKTKLRSLLKVRPRARRLIHSVLVNHEYDLLEARVNMLKDVVDVFVLQESNFTTFGTTKPLHFLEKFQKGWLSEFQDQMAHVFLPSFNEKCQENGWCADAEIRRYLGKHTLRLVESTVQDDDIFLLSDADELFVPEVLLFLKLYNGWGEPIRFGFKWTVFGFFWLKNEDPNELEKIPLLGSFFSKGPKERLLQLWVASTIGMLRDVYVGNGMLLRRNVWDNKILKNKTDSYRNKTKPSGTYRNPVFRGGHTLPFHEWELGGLEHYAGYHCSWCYSPEGIRTKLLSAQKHDKPRWGDYPEKTDVGYIAKLIRIGGWFDDTQPFIKTSPESHPNNYAPKYILDNREKFSYLLDPPSLLESDLIRNRVSNKYKIQEKTSEEKKPEEYDEDLLHDGDGVAL